MCGDGDYKTDAPACPACGGPIGGLRGWNDPKVILKQPRRVGDFVWGAGGCDFLISQSFLTAYQEYNLKGIERIFPVTIHRMGTTKKAKSYVKPKLFGVELKHTTTQVDYDGMDVIWDEVPNKDYCRLCGPGGGGNKGIWSSINRIVVKQETWTGDDIFFAINFSGTVLLSEKAAIIIDQKGFTNVKVIPCEEYKYSFYINIEQGHSL